MSSFTGCCEDPCFDEDNTACLSCGANGPDDEPVDGDYTTGDHLRFYQYGKLAVSVALDDDWRVRVKAHMDAQQFWPSVWFISDHGNAHICSWED